MTESNFAIFYIDKDKSFLRAARTWQQGLSNVACAPCIFIGVSYPYELLNAFQQLAAAAVVRPLSYHRGALFMHSSPPSEESGTGGIHFSTGMRPITLGELRYKEEIIQPTGLNVDTATIGILKRIPKLPWNREGHLSIFGCLSGVSNPGNPSVAEIFAKTQGVPTTGETGKAYFSKSENEYQTITDSDTVVYLKAFYRRKNVLLDLLSGGDKFKLGSFDKVMPSQTFYP